MACRADIIALYLLLFSFLSPYYLLLEKRDKKENKRRIKGDITQI